MSPRLTDWSIALATVIAFMTGVVSLITGHPHEWLIFVLHAIGGFWLLLLMWGKLRRLWPRLVHLRRWDRRTIFGLLALLLVTLALGSGIWWVTGGDLYFVGFNLLNWHIILGFVLTATIVFHMFVRAKRLRKRDIVGRRRVMQFSALLIGGVALWPGEQFTERILNLPGAKQRFTGSHEFFYHELVTAGDELEATLDCTGGFYSIQRWRGIRVGRLLDQVALDRDAHYVSFVSVTSYRWSLPLEEARNALLATHSGEESLSHEHGYPLRLVAPNRRGFQWVKWITRVEVLTTPDSGQVLSIFTSSLTDAGRGE